MIHDARTIRYPDPLLKVNDTIQIDLETGKTTDFVEFDTSNLRMVTGGANLGRIGVITNQERHPGSFNVVHVNGTALPRGSQTSSLLATATNHGSLFPVERVFALPLLRRETRDRQPNRGGDKMISM